MTDAHVFQLGQVLETRGDVLQAERVECERLERRWEHGEVQCCSCEVVLRQVPAPSRPCETASSIRRVHVCKRERVTRTGS